MSESINHEPYKIPARNSNKAYEAGFQLSELASNKKAPDSVSFEPQFFAEIEIDSAINTSFKPAPVPPPTHPAMDEKRRIFKSMRELSWSNHSSSYQNANFYNKQMQNENSRIFYKQAVFMKDFEDDFTETFPFSAYFPHYQLMSYEQLRTYFTWRTKVRNGYIGETSLSYVFVYIYELLNNIGVNDPADGLNEMISFWNVYKFYDTTIEKYLLKWIKDYYIYYRLPKPFQEFLCENRLQKYYSNIVEYEPDVNFDFEYVSDLSKYKIKQSSFYNEQTNQLIRDCYNFVLSKLKNLLKDVGIEFKDLILQPSKSKSVWTPFRGALFYSTLQQPDRQVVLSENEVYLCSQNTWYLGTITTLESGKHLIGYILKHMEAVLRKITNYKKKLSANLNAVNDEIQQKFSAAGISLEEVITEAVQEFYREKNKIVISVSASALDKIRLDALGTQEKLIVPENDNIILDLGSFMEALPMNEEMKEPKESTFQSEDKEMDIPTLAPSHSSAFTDGWTSLKKALSETERNALSALLQGNKDIKQFADNHGVMLEVLADSINEKAFDHIGDNILGLDDTMTLYDEYREKIIIMVE
ncbi:MAG: hypothetical protein K0S47_463 [Herbinix sp.]|jgi:hypothetical protein|nr:hypothetical protein [Herbinix sp.]